MVTGRYGGGEECWYDQKRVGQERAFAFARHHVEHDALTLDANLVWL